MTRRKRSTSVAGTGLLAGVLLLGACDGTPQLTAPDAGSARKSTAAAESPESQGQKLAQGLALAMRDVHVRNAVRHAFRDSPRNEHKLVFQEFVQTPHGRAVLASAAAAMGVDPTAAQGWIAQLPRLDLYVPLREHRRSWTGSDDLVVGFNLSPDETRLTGYAANGSVVRLDRRNGIPKQTVIILHTAEPKWNRTDAGRPARRETIEDPSMQASVIEACETGPVDESKPTCEVTGEPTYPTYPVYARRLYIKAFYPRVGDGWGDLELHFKHYHVTQDWTGARTSTKVWEWITSGAWENEWKVVNKITGGGNEVRVFERDSDFEPSGHDDWGGGVIQGDAATYNWESSLSTTYANGWCRAIHADWATDAYCGFNDYQMTSIEIQYEYKP
jgi:hypothetical protein